MVFTSLLFALVKAEIAEDEKKLSAEVAAIFDIIFYFFNWEKFVL